MRLPSEAFPAAVTIMWCSYITAAEHKDCIQDWQLALPKLPPDLQPQQKETESPFNKPSDSEASNHIQTRET